jgi:hypothetical protein
MRLRSMALAAAAVMMAAPAVAQKFSDPSTDSRSAKRLWIPAGGAAADRAPRGRIKAARGLDLGSDESQGNVAASNSDWTSAGAAAKD